MNYADRGLQYDQEGDNRNLNVGFATSAERVQANPLAPKDPNVLPGAIDVAAPDGPGGDAGRATSGTRRCRAGLKRAQLRLLRRPVPLRRRGRRRSEPRASASPGRPGIKVFYAGQGRR